MGFVRHRKESLSFCRKQGKHECMHAVLRNQCYFIIMPILYHNTAIRSVFFNSSHLCYLRRQAKDAIAYMTVTEHIVIIEHAPVVITLVY